jgi:hypothetical protein
MLGTGTLAVLLVLGALCDTVESLISPLTSSTTYADVTAIAHHQDRFVLSVVIGVAGTALLLPALLGLAARTFPRAPVASRVAAGLVCLGLPGFMAIRMGQAVELQGVRDGLPRRTTADLIDHLSSNPVGAPIMVFFLGGTVLGLLALAVATWRAGLPRPAAVLLGAFGILDIALEEAVPSWATHLLLLAALGWLAVALVRGSVSRPAAPCPAGSVPALR